MTIRQPYKKFTFIEQIELLEMIRDFDAEIVKNRWELTAKELKYFKWKHNAYDADKINMAIYKLESQISGSADYPHRDYKKQEKCDHENFKLMLKCTCSKVLSENDIDELIDILERKREKLKVGVRVFNLTGNKVIN